MAYQLRTKIGERWGEWSNHTPNEPLRNALDHRPDARILLNNGQTEWRKSPRDWVLINAITEIVRDPANSDVIVADRIYSLLEERGLL